MKIIKAFMILIIISMPLFSEWYEKSIKLEDSVWASSVFEEDASSGKITYSAENVFDGKLSTCWVEGAEGDGIGESVTFVYNTLADSISFINGFAKNENYFKNNNRIKKLKIYMTMAFSAPGLVSENDYYLYYFKDNANPVSITLDDNSSSQYFSFPYTYMEQHDYMINSFKEFLKTDLFFIKFLKKEYNLGDVPTEQEVEDAFELYMPEYGMYCIKIEIENVYKGDKYSDTCLSEISIFP